MIVNVQNVTRRKQLLCLGGYGIFLMYGICLSFLFKKLLLPLTMVVSACLLAWYRNGFQYVVYHDLSCPLNHVTNWVQEIYHIPVDNFNFFSIRKFSWALLLRSAVVSSIDRKCALSSPLGRSHENVIVRKRFSLKNLFCWDFSFQKPNPNRSVYLKATVRSTLKAN